MKKRSGHRFSAILTLFLILMMGTSVILPGFSQIGTKHKPPFIRSVPSLQRDQYTKRDGMIQEPTDHVGRPLYHKGMITLKLKQRLKSHRLGKSMTTLGVNSLDQKLARINAKSIEKRFKHREIPPESNLPDLSCIYIITIPNEVEVLAAAQMFADDPNVEYAEPIPVRYDDTVPSDMYYTQLQHLPQIKAEEAWDVHKGEDGGEPVIIGICDTGVEWTHPDLVDNLWQNLGEDADGDGHVIEWDGEKWIFDPDDENGQDDDDNGYQDDFIGWDFVASMYVGDEDNNPLDPRWHGTHIAGIAAGVTDNITGISSISYNVKYLPTSHAYDSEDESQYRNSDGIIYLAENGADIINCSWSGEGYSKAEEEVIAYASGLGSIIVGGAGNNNTNKYHYPSTLPHVVSVASVASTDEKAGYSQYGIGIDVSAPGGDPFVDGGILSTFIGNSYERAWGTSMACPLAAGLAGLIKSYKPDWTNQQIVTQLIGTTDNIDAQNVGYISQLGSGRINAYRALTETEVTVPQVLRLAIHDVLTPGDADGDGSIEVGETASLNLVIRNYAHFVSSENVTFTLSSPDPDIRIPVNTHTVSVGEDDYTRLEDAFRIRVKLGSRPHFAAFNLTAENGLPVQTHPMEFQMMVAQSGIFVWEGTQDGLDQSGAYISDFLTNHQIDHFYTNTFPMSLVGYDVVFLSFGSSFNADYVSFTGAMADAVVAYLKGGGHLYLEGNRVLGWDQGENSELHALLGMEHATLGASEWSWIENMVGEAGSIAEGLNFNGVTQITPIQIDTYQRNQTGKNAFEEAGQGVVAVQHEGDHGQKTFCFSYALADFLDGELPNSRVNLLSRILNFFDIDVRLASDFGYDTHTGHAPLTVTFRDLSFFESEAPTQTWAWDFDNNGIIDSDAQHPSHTYNEPGDYSVSLQVTNASGTQALVRTNVIRVFDGESALAFDGIELSSMAYVYPDASLNLTNTLTMEAWIKPSGWGSNSTVGFGRILDKSGYCLLYLHNDGYSDYARKSLVFAMTHADGTDSAVNTPANSIELNKWQHVAVTYDGNESQSTIYINGVKQELTQPTPPSGELADNSEAYLYIGNCDLWDRTFDGVIDEVRIWNRVRSDKQIHDNHTEYLNGNEEGLVGYWRLNGGQGNALTDLSPSGNMAAVYRTQWVPGLPPELTNVEENRLPESAPRWYRLSQNYPNPFNLATEITYTLPKASKVTLRIYNIRGEEVWHMKQKGLQPAGVHTLMWNGQDQDGAPLSSGIYFYRLETDHFVQVKKMTMLK